MIEALSIFVSVFLAELGDKTQIAALLFAANAEIPPIKVFLVASVALVFSTGLAVLAGSAGARFVEGMPVKLIAGVAFVAIGLWQIAEHFRGL